MSSVPKSSAVTWYDVLGVLPDATQQEIRTAWQARRAALAPGLLAGAAPDVLAAAGRAGQAVDEAGRVLGDAATRQAYDVDVGVVRPGEGLEPPGVGPTGPDVTLASDGPRRTSKPWRIPRSGRPMWWRRMSAACSITPAWRWPGGLACTSPRSS